MNDTHTNFVASPADRLDPFQTADLLGVRVQTLAIWRSSGRHGLPYTKVGRRIFYSRQSVLDWMSRRTGTSCSQIAAAIA
jgi:predicted site-specific integrase-resolvase